MSLFNITLLTIFPEMFPGPLQYSLAGKALREGIWSCNIINIRDFGIGKHKKIDDAPCGGGNGLVMRADVLSDALDSVLKNNKTAKIIYPSPRGKRLSQELVHQIKEHKNIVILCGRFEGVDERVIDEYNAMEVSLGDYILSGGEIAAMAIIDSVVRLLPGVLSNQETIKEESFEIEITGDKLLEYPLYTKPNIWRNRHVPDILLSGNHSKINKWRQDQSLSITRKNRPDLLGNTQNFKENKNA